MTRGRKRVLPKRAEAQLTVDTVIFTVREGQLEVLLVRRGVAPFRGDWAIPGGFLLEGESPEAAALRELEEETGVTQVYLEQLYTFGAPDRDPRGRVVTIAYFALVASDRLEVRGGSDASDARWWPMDALPTVAFDHAAILAYALERVRNKLEYTTVGFQLLPRRFTLSAQRIQGFVLGEFGVSDLGLQVPDDGIGFT